MANHCLCIHCNKKLMTKMTNNHTLEHGFREPKLLSKYKACAKGCDMRQVET